MKTLIPKRSWSFREVSSALALVLAPALTGCATTEGSAGNQSMGKCEAQMQLVSTHIATFDTLDFDVFTHQKWDRLHESHSKDILVHWPDGHTTKGIDRHIEDLKGMFIYAPDTRIQVHPVKFGSDEWTSVIGEMEGTFTVPMPVGGGKTLPPTGKSFKIVMCTVGHWKDGVMDEEYLFWDNQTYMKQLGLAP
jgi:SnoaL-like polyketide cyclase